MFVIRRSLLSNNYSKLIFIKQQIKVFSSNEIKKIKNNLKTDQSNDKLSNKPLTSAVVLKNNEDVIKDEKVDFNIAIKDLEIYDDNSQVVYDITDEKLGEDDDESKFKYLYQNKPIKELMFGDPKLTKRGKEGVFDLDQIIYALEKEKVKDIAVIKIPDDVLNNKCFVIGSAKSAKHLSSVFDYIVKLYKIKKSPNDKFPHYEGLNSKSWKIIDMDIIMLHLFLEEKREFYDIEQLWTVGAEYDDKCRIKKDKIEELLEEHSKNLEEKEQSKQND